jgi:hypothetical protein
MVGSLRNWWRWWIEQRYNVGVTRGVALILPHPVMCAVFIFCWAAFLLFWRIADVDTHFTNRPQDYPQFFTVTPWRPITISTAIGPQKILTRTATCPLTFSMLRMTYSSADGGATSEWMKSDDDWRWGRLGIAIALSTFALCSLHAVARHFNPSEKAK